MSMPEGWAEGDPSNLPDPPEYDVFTMLSTRRRRLAVIILTRLEGPVELGRLARYIAAIENAKPLAALTSDDRKPVYVGLYQNDSEKLVESGLIDADDRVNRVWPTERTYRVADRLTDQMAAEEPAALEAVDRVLAEDGHGRASASIPVDVSLFRVPTGDQFRALRRGAGLTQTDIAEAIGVSNRTISTFETGGHSIASGTLRAAIEYIRRRQGGDTDD